MIALVIRIIRPHQFAEFNVAQLHIRARLHGSFLRVYADLVQAPNLLVRETKILAHAGIFRHAQKALAATKSAPAAALPYPSVPRALHALPNWPGPPPRELMLGRLPHWCCPPPPI